MVSKSEKAVLAVLAYSAQFDHPLTVSEILERMLTGRGLEAVDADFSGGERFSAATIRRAITSLIRKKRLIQKGEWLTLAGKARAFHKRRLAQKVTAEKEPLVEELVGLVERCPWILGLGITGSHAVGGAVEKDDIDFLVVTQKNRLWLARLWLLFYAWSRGRRPHIPGDISHSWDLNFWLDETRLRLPPRKRTAYEAYELLQTRWVFDRGSTRDTLFRANRWIEGLLARPPRVSEKNLSHRRTSSWFFDALNAVAFLLQIGYRTLRHGRQKADVHSAFFHPSSTRGMVFLAWKSLYQRALGRTVVLATGVFDVLHNEHKKFLTAARQAGDFLVVGIEADARVRRSKGPGRPIFPQAKRIAHLQQWNIADEVFALPEQFSGPQRQQFIQQVWPHVLAVSSHSPHLGDKRRVLRSVGGRVAVVLPHNPAVSTTQLLTKQR